MTEQVDVAIVGAGPGGYVAAIRASQLGLKTALIEKDAIGGTCLNRGCIPTKALLRSAEVYALARDSEDYGVRCENVTLDWPQVQKRQERIVSRLRKGVEALLKKNRVAVLPGVAALASPNELLVRSVEGESVQVAARHIVIATGAQAKSLPGIVIDEQRILSSTGALQLQDVPESIVVVGAGVVGVEFASLFRSLGTDVTLLEALPHILPLEDAEIADALAKSLRRQGMRIEAGARVERVETGANGVGVTVITAAGKIETFSAQRLLMAVGREPATENLGLEAAGVKTERGWIAVNEFMQTSVPSIYAIGDCVATPQLAHVASAEGILAAEHIAECSPSPLNYDHMPRCVYSHPEVSSVGLTEEQARERGYTPRTAAFPFLANSKAVILGVREGFVKMVADEGTDALLGVQIVGPGATELIAEAVLALRLECTAEEFSRTVHPHPTVSEALMEAARALVGMPVHI